MNHSLPVAGNICEYLPDRGILDSDTDWNEESNDDDLAPLFDGSGTAYQKLETAAKRSKQRPITTTRSKQQDIITKRSKPQPEIEATIRNNNHIKTTRDSNKRIQTTTRNRNNKDIQTTRDSNRLYLHYTNIKW